VIAAALLAALALTGSAWAAEVQRARMLMGTVLTAVVEAPDTVAAAAAIDSAFDEVARLERVMSSWRGDNELSRLNAAGLEPFRCSPDLYAVLDSALALARDTGGAFDPMVEPLMRAWDVRGAGRVPSAAERGAARALVDWHGLALDARARTARLERAGMGVDLGGIGKGYALDRVLARLRAARVAEALVDFGGQVAVLTRSERAIAIADPGDRLRAIVTLPLANGSASTSAQSEHGFTRRGRRYGHIVDPRTGAPVATRASVTVVCASATRADALSTALLVMGRAGAAGWGRDHPEDGVLWLEPHAGRVRAWTWNLAPAEIAGAVAWMNDARQSNLMKGAP